MPAHYGPTLTVSKIWGACVAPSFEGLALGFGSGGDLVGCGIKPSGCPAPCSVGSLLEGFSPSAPPPTLSPPAHSLKINR